MQHTCAACSCATHVCTQNTRGQCAHAPSCHHHCPHHAQPSLAPVPSSPAVPHHPAPSVGAAHCPAPGAAPSTPHRLHRPHLPLRSHGAEFPPRGVGPRWPRGRALPPPGSLAFEKQKAPESLRPRSARPARPSGRRPLAAPPHPLPPLVPRPARPLSVGARTPRLQEQGSGGNRSETGRGLGSPPGQSSPSSPCKQGTSGRREQTAEV